MPGSQPLHLPEPWLREVRAILRAHLPEAEVWAYGSRVNGDHYDASDLDLVAHLPDSVEKLKRFTRLDEVKEAFVESKLPIIVQIVDWNAIPQSFRDEILAGYVVIQVGRVSPEDVTRQDNPSGYAMKPLTRPTGLGGNNGAEGSSVKLEDDGHD